jgi:ABC-type lipoprotein release transport system permease subunit
MLFKLAWRNVWRNKRRSLIVIGSVIVGMIAVILSDGLSNGMLRQMLDNQISSNILHIQIHKKGFNDNKIIKNYIEDSDRVEAAVNNTRGIKAYTKRVITFGLLSSANSSAGVFIYGIQPETEKEVSVINSYIKEGNFLGTGKRDIAIGQKLAEKLDVGLGDKVVAMANTPSGSIGSDMFRVAGIFQTASSDYDKVIIYVPIETAQSMLELNDKSNEFAMMLNDYKNVASVKEELSAKLGSEYEVLSYQDLLPMLIFQMDLYRESMWILNLIIGLALIFGIINTMLMSVFERIQEIGVLMAAGMKSYQIYFMFIFEALIIGIIGTLLGIAAGLLVHLPLSFTGIDFSLFSEALESFGVGAVIYPVLSIENLISVLIIIPMIAVAGALYPAYKAVKLEPVYAINYV